MLGSSCAHIIPMSELMLSLHNWLSPQASIILRTGSWNVVSGRMQLGWKE